jgi:ATP-dependent protease Clp ATPase subunit
MCSFCGSARDEVATLMKGPGATICDRCIDNASADVVTALLAV